MEFLTVHVDSEDPSVQKMTKLEEVSGVYSVVKKYASKRRMSESSKKIFFGVSKENKTETNSKLITYFESFNKMEFRQSEIPEIDINLIEAAINAGADVNEVDIYGQTIIHDAASNWSTDIVEYLIQNGAKLNVQDKFGRTPLHVAATADYPEMIEFLIQNGANVETETFIEKQTPVHYAAKNDSVKSLKALIKFGASYKTVKDYKMRTPLFLAAELDRSESALLLLEYDAPVEERDYNGQTPIIWMVNKMPKIAIEALEKLHKRDKRKRRQEYRLDCLENIKNSPDDFSPPNLIKTIVNNDIYELFECPIVRKLIRVKWQKYGRMIAWMNMIITLLLNILWTVLFFLLPGGSVYKYTYPKDYGIIFIWVLGLAFLFWTWFNEIQEYLVSNSYNKKWEAWRENEIMKDREFCHPQYPEESTYWDIELEITKAENPSYFSDNKNIIDWIVFLLLLSCFIIHLIALGQNDANLGYNLKRVFSFALICLWMRFLLTVKFFHSLGPFIVIMTLTIKDIVRFLFIYLILFIPFYCGFWVFFGGSSGYPTHVDRFSTGNVSLLSVSGFDSVRQGIFTMFRISMVDDYDYTNMSAIDPIMSDILLGCWIFSTSIICINLLIALLSDTFQRVYDNANSNSIMQRAKLILAAEESRLFAVPVYKCYKYLTEYCNPAVEFFDDDDSSQTKDLQKVTLIIRDKLDEMYDYVTNNKTEQSNVNSETLEEILKTVKRMDNDIQRIKRHLRASRLERKS